MPNVEMAVKSIFLKPNSKVLILNCGIGVLGLVFASINQRTKFFLYDSNIQNVKLLLKNLKLNRIYTRNASVTTIESLLLKSIDTVIYDVSSGFVSLKTLADNIRLVKKLLKQNGLFYCISHTKVGAKRHQDIIRRFFGNVVNIAKGKGGYRVFKAINKSETLIDKQNKNDKLVEFTIFNKHFSLITKPGVFSKDRLDEGTRLLLEKAPIFNFSNLLDFGCGWGAIGIVAATLNPRGKAVLVDINTRAIDAAVENIKRYHLTDRVKVLATDDVSVIKQNFDLVLTNPPFHENTDNLIKMFKKIKKVISDNGKIYLVVEKTYLEKFKKVLKKVFGQYQIVN